jgi:DNA-binding transcriptional ArsR family regulator
MMENRAEVRPDPQGDPRDERVNTQDVEAAVSAIASAIGEPARARILFSLLDGHARTNTELAAVSEVGQSTASGHLHRLQTARLVKAVRQGKHCYYSLAGPDVGTILEKLSVFAGRQPEKFTPNTPTGLREARSCYDHIAGKIGVALHDRFKALGWLSDITLTQDNAYDVTPDGVKAFAALGIDIDATRSLRRRFAIGCLDWSERRFHLAGGLGAAFLEVARKRRWVQQDLDSRALRVTEVGRREMLSRFGIGS